jgi:Fungal chitosanase of glycosyl hydrolase group 75
MQIDVDGAYHSYHPDGRSGLDQLGNAGRPGSWWALVTDTGRPDGNPVIQAANDPAPGFYISRTELQDPTRDRRDPRRYVNSEDVNYIVLPSELLGENAIAGKATVRLGDLAVVIHPGTGAQACAIVAEIGPRRRIGEGSIALANALRINSDPMHGGVSSGIVYVIFPGSGEGRPLSKDAIDQKGAPLFYKWGGIDKAKSSFPKLKW